ncbi:aspartate carbamoyltransferase [Candidatus Beckwithbacteria bacterium]|nr:aspartate carbamoyltransferase [Candidatus Beckwithbacteria bacterium]
MAANLLYNQSLLSVDQISKEKAELILDTARQMRELVKSKGSGDSLKGKVVTALFYEPSSRTFASFITAAQRLGAGFLPLQGMTYSSVAKGENLADTVRTFASYSDCIVIRHPEVGSAKIAADFSPKPVINAGDGVGEHPTQALLDLCTIADHFKNIGNLEVTMVGDLLNGRTVHSLSKLLSMYPAMKINLVSPQLLQMPKEFISLLEKRKVKVSQSETLDKVIGSTDILYVTRVQKERFTDLTSYEKLKHHYIITTKIANQMKKQAIIMHPFPRVGEIEMDVDLDPRAAYIKDQIPNGMYVRMALLQLILLP